VLIMAEAAARDVAFRNKEIDTSILDRRSTSPIAPIRSSPRGILEVAEMFTRADDA
jgi:peptide/nickel transport system substrate-binding protein